jgi:hypothetical protein
MIRKTNARPAWRIKDRQVRQRLMEIDELLLALSDTHDLKNLRNELWDSAAKTHRSVMRF